MTDRPHIHSLYGLTLVSDIRLRGLPPGRTDGRNLVRICRAPVSDPSIAERDPWVFANTGPQQLLAWAAVGAFRIAADDRIEVDPNPGVPDSLVALPLLGAVMATLLHRRGLLVLHASAVAVNGVAVALLGDKGAGKSTTAGALVAAGNVLISDDIVALDYATGRPCVLPAHGELKLWPDSGEHLSRAGLGRIGPIHDRIDKASFTTQREARHPAPLGRLYLLEQGEMLQVTQPPTSDALRLLLRHGYVGRFGTPGFGEHLPLYFARAASLAAHSVRILTIPRNLDRLAEIEACIRDDLEPGSNRAAMAAAE